LTLISTTPGPDPRLSPGDEAVFAGLDRPVQTDADIAELEVGFCRAVAGSRFGFDEQYYRDLVAADLARGMNPAANAPSASSRIDQLARIQVPTLVVHGTEDPVYPYDHAEVLATGIPTATLVRWEGVGHEQPPQLVPEADPTGHPAHRRRQLNRRQPHDTPDRPTTSGLPIKRHVTACGAWCTQAWSTDVMARCCASGLLQGMITPLEPCRFLVRHPAVGKGPLTCKDMTGCEYVSVDPG
jgi:TAP-like protein